MLLLSDVAETAKRRKTSLCTAFLPKFDFKICKIAVNDTIVFSESLQNRKGILSSAIQKLFGAMYNGQLETMSFIFWKNYNKQNEKYIIVDLVDYTDPTNNQIRRFRHPIEVALRGTQMEGI